MCTGRCGRHGFRPIEWLGDTWPTRRAPARERVAKTAHRKRPPSTAPSKMAHPCAMVVSCSAVTA
eukprot:scaffold85080_cov31-Tisochrysis_lutea.AAC.12